jgi:hypothetical protein
MTNSLASSNPIDFCGAVVIDAGYLLDPTKGLVAAKQLSTNLERNVVMRYNTGAPSDHVLEYYIQFDDKLQIGVIKQVVVRSLVS